MGRIVNTETAAAENIKAAVTKEGEEGRTADIAASIEREMKMTEKLANRRSGDIVLIRGFNR